tara:strand:- start:28 stop:270 length:243 start_codon:yes stop_codon:yes gene_type:complete
MRELCTGEGGNAWNLAEISLTLSSIGALSSSFFYIKRKASERTNRNRARDGRVSPLASFTTDEMKQMNDEINPLRYKYTD